jgi:hypothetical protein
VKVLVLWIVIAGALLGAPAHAQSLAGTWQGTLNAGKDLSIVITASSSNARRFPAA